MYHLSVEKMICCGNVMTKLQVKLAHEMDNKLDSLRFYFLGLNWQQRIEHEGTKELRDLEGLLIL
jgi:CRISPR-associated protein Cas2